MFSIANLLQLIIFDNSAHSFFTKFLNQFFLRFRFHAVSPFLLYLLVLISFNVLFGMTVFKKSWYSLVQNAFSAQFLKDLITIKITMTLHRRYMMIVGTTVLIENKPINPNKIVHTVNCTLVRFWIKLDVSVETVFSIYSFLRSLRIMITNYQRKVCMFIFIAQKNPRPKQARKIWSTSIWPPATRQNQHMNQSKFWPCRLSNRFQKYLTLWALESLCPICQGKIMDSVQDKKNAHFLAANFHHR